MGNDGSWHRQVSTRGCQLEVLCSRPVEGRSTGKQSHLDGLLRALFVVSLSHALGHRFLTFCLLGVVSGVVVSVCGVVLPMTWPGGKGPACLQKSLPRERSRLASAKGLASCPVWGREVRLLVCSRPILLEQTGS